MVMLCMAEYAFEVRMTIQPKAHMERQKFKVDVNDFLWVQWEQLSDCQYNQVFTQNMPVMSYDLQAKAQNEIY